MKKYTNLIISLIITLGCSSCDVAESYGFLLVEDKDSVKSPFFSYENQGYIIAEAFTTESFNKFLKEEKFTQISVVDADNRNIKCDSINLDNDNITLFVHKETPISLNVFDLKKIILNKPAPLDYRLDNMYAQVISFALLGILLDTALHPENKFKLRATYIFGGIGIISGTGYMLKRNECEIFSYRYVK